MNKSVLQRINERCDQFERDWKSNQQPGIEQYLQGFEGDQRKQLFGYLLELDIDYRQLNHCSLAEHNYNRQFPEYAAITAERLSDDSVDPLATLDYKSLGSADSAEPTIEFGHYRVIEVLGKGGMGAVYLAYDKQLDRQVAIKVPFVNTAQADSIVERFLREARALAAIVHPNICPIHEVGQQDGVPYMVMTHVQGKPLNEKSVQPETIAGTVELVKKLAFALHHSHQVGVVHRDLKPSNVVINYLNEPVILDFGLAHIDRRDAGDLTVHGSIIGTPAYMSPEQVRGQTAKIKASTDIYTLGVILYELLTERRPFDGELYEMMRKITDTDADPPSSIRPEIDTELDKICRTAMAKSIHDRYGRMIQFATVLDEYLKRLAAEQAKVDTKKDSKRGNTMRPGGTRTSGTGGTSAKKTLTRTKSRGASVVASAGDWQREAADEDEGNHDGLPETASLRNDDYGYNLVKVIGKGQYGEVWLAMAPGGIEVAVKKVMFPTGHRATQAELRALELIKGLRHPLLLQVHAYWIVGDQLMIVMELAEDSLEDVLEKHTGDGIPRGKLFGYMREASEAIDFLHGEGVLHRDIKPANLLLLKEHVKVADFGIAMSGQFGRDDLLVKANTLGTPLYMAPELWNKQAGPRSDQYSLAVTYLELRLGREPDFDDNDRVVVGGVPEAEQVVLRKALSEDPVDRFETCTEFAAALDKIIEDEKDAARRKILQRRSLFAAAGLLIVGAPSAMGLQSILAKRSALAAIPTGFSLTPDATLVTVGNASLYDRIVRTFDDGTEILFVLIPRTDNVDLESFYCMQNEVTGANFAQFTQTDNGRTISDRWSRGAPINSGVLPPSDHPELPVTGVSANEADAFAQWIGCRLPTMQQWHKAAGRWDHVADDLGPYRASSGETPNVAVDRGDKGPLPVGTATDDVSVFGCRDMAGNVREWTRTTDDPEIFVPIEDIDAGYGIVTCGYDYRDPEPLTFVELEDTIYHYDIPGRTQPYGFRCIAEIRATDQ